MEFYVVCLFFSIVSVFVCNFLFNSFFQAKFSPLMSNQTKSNNNLSVSVPLPQIL